MPEYTVIIQCRLSSKRLPNKILLKIGHKTFLEFLINRLKKIEGLKIVCAIAKEKGNSKLKRLLRNNKIDFFEGPEKNVLKRYYMTAKFYKCKNIIRITSDCPLIDHRLIEEGIKIFKSKKLDYLSNNLLQTFPHGLDFEIFNYKSLKKAYKNGNSFSEIEHVTEYIKKNKGVKKFNLKSKIILDKYYRWTLDTEKDLIFFRKLYKEYLIKNNNVKWKKIYNFLKKRNDISKINSSTHHFYFN